MAAVNDCFQLGSIVSCTTCFHDEVEGEVMGFDHNTKMLILSGSKSSTDLNDVYVLNLSLCSNVHVVKECNGNFAEEPQKLNLEQIKIRLRNTVQQRQTYLKSKNADVSPYGQELYRVIAKQFKYNEVSWQGLNIQIFNEVTVYPPYRVENVVTNSGNPSLCNYIKKMIEQYTSHKTQDTSDNSSPSPSSLSSSNAASSSPVPAN